MKRIFTLFITVVIALGASAQKEIDYIALVLDDASHSVIYHFAQRFCPWEDEAKYYCHHMTIAHHTNLTPEMKEWAEAHEGEKFTATATAIGHSDKAFALHITNTEVPSLNTIKHVTLATHPSADGHAVDSNFITDWHPLKYSLTLSGKVTIIYKGL